MSERFESFVFYVWTGEKLKDPTAISTGDRDFVFRVKRWAESQGFKVELPKELRDGPEHK